MGAHQILPASHTWEPFQCKESQATGFAGRKPRMKQLTVSPEISHHPSPSGSSYHETSSGAFSSFVDIQSAQLFCGDSSEWSPANCDEWLDRLEESLRDVEGMDLMNEVLEEIYSYKQVVYDEIFSSCAAILISSCCCSVLNWNFGFSITGMVLLCNLNEERVAEATVRDGLIGLEWVMQVTNLRLQEDPVWNAPNDELTAKEDATFPKVTTRSSAFVLVETVTDLSLLKCCHTLSIVYFSVLLVVVKCYKLEPLFLKMVRDRDVEEDDCKQMYNAI
nr:hypothetical protein Iba_chr12aCG2330 [Ipomoea batatas]